MALTPFSKVKHKHHDSVTSPKLCTLSEFYHLCHSVISEKHPLASYPAVNFPTQRVEGFMDLKKTSNLFSILINRITKFSLAENVALSSFVA